MRRGVGARVRGFRQPLAHIVAGAACARLAWQANARRHGADGGQPAVHGAEDLDAPPVREVADRAGADPEAKSVTAWDWVGSGRAEAKGGPRGGQASVLD